MKYIISLLLILLSFFVKGQDEFYRSIDWEFFPKDLVQINDSTYTVTAIPEDYNDPGAELKGNYVADFVGRRYAVTDLTDTTATLVDIAKTGKGPQLYQSARMYQSVGLGEARYIGSVNYFTLDQTARWKLNGADNELLWQHGIEYNSPFKRTVQDTNYVITGLEPKGTSYWDETEKTYSDVLGDGVIGQRYKELFKTGQNDTGADILNGTPVEYAGSIGNSGNFRIQGALVEKNKPSYYFIGIATQDIANGEIGKIATHGKARGITTDGSNYGEVWTDGTIVYPSHITRGYLTKTPPPAPYAAIPAALVISAHPTNGTLEVNPSYPQRIDELVDVDGTLPNQNYALLYDTLNKFWDPSPVLIDYIPYLRDYLNFFNGTFREPFDARTSSDGSTITMTLERKGGGDLTMRFSDGLDTLDCTPPATITLTAGFDSIPTENWIYIPKATKVLTKTTSEGFPTDEEHIKVGYFFVPSALQVQSDGGTLINQNWNSEAMDNTNQGHLTHMGATIRYKIGYRSGLDPNGLNQLSAVSYFNYVSATESYFKATSGSMRQMHDHQMPAVNTQTGDDIHVVNFPNNAYRTITRFNEITQDAEGNSLANKYFNIFIFAVGNKGGEYSPTMLMLPSGSYITETNAINDISKYDNLVMPREFVTESSNGVPICRMTLRYTGGTTTLTHVATLDLRRSAVTGGGGSGSGIVSLTQATDFPDSYTGQANKLLQVDAGESTVEFIAKGDIPLTDFDSTNFTLSQSQVVGLPDSIAAHRTDINQNASDISALQAESHPEVTKTGTGTFIQVNEPLQSINVDKIDLTNTNHITGELPDANVANNITLDNITQITNRAHSNTTGLDFASSGHTGFAGTGVNNTFTSTYQQISSIAPILRLSETGATNDWAIVVDGNNFQIRENYTSDGRFTIQQGGDVVIANDISANNLSGTNTGDETLSSIQSLVSNDFHNLGGVDIDNQTLSIDSTGRVFTIGISNENSVSFEDTNTQLTDGEISAFGFIKNADETDQVYSGDSANIVWFSDLLDNDPTNELQDTSEIDGLLEFVQNYSIDSYTETDPIYSGDSANIVHFDELDYFTGADITGNEAAFDGWDKNVADDFSGDYNDLINKPTIPTVHDYVITLQRNGIEIGNFSLNQNFPETFNFIDENTTYVSSDFDHDLIQNTHNLTTDIDHTQILNVGTNTHTQIDSHIASISNPHLVGFNNLSDYTRVSTLPFLGLQESDASNQLWRILGEGGNIIIANETYDADFRLRNFANANVFSVDMATGTINTGIWNGSIIGDSYITKTGNWTGTFDGQEGSYYLSRNNHTGTQLASTISNFDAEVSNNIDVSANTTSRHPAVTLSGTPDYITINPTTQVITRNQIDLTTDVTGVLSDANVDDNITLDNITQITNRSHTNLTDIGVNTHAQIDTDLTRLANTSGTNTGDQTSSDFTHNDLLGLNDGTTYQHITTTQETNFETAYTHSQVTTGNPHNVLATQISDFDTEVSNNSSVQAALALDLQDVTDNGNTTTNSITVNGLTNIGDAMFESDGEVNESLLITTDNNSNVSKLLLRHDSGLQGGLDLYSDRDNSQAVIEVNNSSLFPLIFKIRGGDGINERMRITKNGNVLINSTTDNGVDKLQVNGTVTHSPATASNQGVVLSQLEDASLNVDFNSATVNGTSVWTADNDGLGSGLDADLLDGQSGAYYLDNTDDQTASEVNITDIGGYYTGIEVESALQEIGSDIAAFQLSNHPAVTKTGTGTFIQVNEPLQTINVDQIDLTSDVTDVLPLANQELQDLSGKQDNISLTTSGTSGAATFISDVLNIPRYDTYTDNELSDLGLFSGTDKYYPRWNGTSLVNSSFYQLDANRVMINTTNEGSGFYSDNSISTDRLLKVGVQNDNIFNVTTDYHEDNTTTTGDYIVFNVNGEKARITSIGDLTVSNALFLGDYFAAGTFVPAGYYQDEQNGAYRARVTSGNGGYYFQSYNGGSTKLFIGLLGTYSGRVGVNTISPGYNLDVTGDARITSNITFLSSLGNGSDNGATIGDIESGDISAWFNSVQASGNIQLGTGLSGSTSTPTYLTTGNSYSNGTTKDKLKIYLYNDGANEQYGFGVGGSGDIQYHSNNRHDFYINNSLLARMQSDGILVSGSVGIAADPYDSSWNGLQEAAPKDAVYDQFQTLNVLDWDEAYDDKINSIAVTGTTTRSITLTQQDGGTVSTQLFWTGTQTAYDALGSYNNNTIYFIED